MDFWVKSQVSNRKKNIICFESSKNMLFCFEQFCFSNIQKSHCSMYTVVMTYFFIFSFLCCAFMGMFSLVFP